jgi:hypothetical protein
VDTCVFVRDVMQIKRDLGTRRERERERGGGGEMGRVQDRIVEKVVE